MTKALVALHDTTYGGVYYSANVDFVAKTNPVWTRYATTGLANNLIKVMQNDYADPYGVVYVQLDNDDIYKWNGSSWTKIMDLATARTASGATSGTVGNITANKTVAGRIYLPINDPTGGGAKQYILVSTDYGANWTSRLVIAYDLLSGQSYASATGNHVWMCYGHLYRSMQYSADNGTTWSAGDYPIWVNSAGGQQFNIDLQNGTGCYYRKSAADNTLTRYYYSGGYSSTDLQANLATNYAQNAPGTHWQSWNTTGKQRIIVYTGYLFATTDGWSTLVEASPTRWETTGAVTVPITNIHAAREDESLLLIGGGGPVSAAGNSRVWAWTGEDTSVQPWNAGGANFASAPYTDSLPSPSQSYVAIYGVFCGNAPATSGVYVYSVETDIFDDDHIPMKGDRSAWQTRQYPDEHAEDVQEDNPTIHNIWPVANGNIEVSDGNKWVETTPAAFGIHAAVTLAADADTLLGLSTQQLTLDTQTANRVFAGPTTGAAADPTFRAIVADDLASGGDLTKILRGDMSWTTLAAEVLNYTHEHTINEDLSGLCDGSRTVFILANEYQPEMTAIYLNGVRQLLATDYTEDAGYDQITLSIAPVAGDVLIADYILAGAI